MAAFWVNYYYAIVGFFCSDDGRALGLKRLLVHIW
jgi:hypothetical protein